MVRRFTIRKEASIRRSLALAALFAAAPVAAAAVLADGGTVPGDLDPSFSSDGRVLTDLGGADDRIRELLVRPDGSIVAVGSGGPGGGLALVRYRRDGSLDAEFGADGVALLDDDSGSIGATAAVLQPDGRIVIAGVSEAPDGQDLAIARLTAEGRPDQTFGVAGRVLIDAVPAAADLDYLFAVTVQQDGRLVAAGQTSHGRETGRDVVVVRLEPDGRLDERFGTGGVVVTDIAPGSDDSAAAVAVQADGKIVVGGSANGRRSGFGLLRYTRDGRLDEGFGRGGTIVSDAGFGGFAEVRALVLGPGGRVLAVGWGQAGGVEVVLAIDRYTAAGRLDQSFGLRGRVRRPIVGGSLTSAAVLAAAAQRDGKLVVGGVAAGDLFVARYLAGGRRDTTFGGTGLVATSFGPGRIGVASAVAVQADGRILAGGGSARAERSDFALARYVSGGRPGTRFASLGVRREARGNRVAWRTTAEVGTAGFHLYRGTDGTRVRLTRAALPSRGRAGRGATYSFLDRRARGLAYWLEEIARDGSRRWYGPVAVTG